MSSLIFYACLDTALAFGLETWDICWSCLMVMSLRLL